MLFTVSDLAIGRAWETPWRGPWCGGSLGRWPCPHAICSAGAASARRWIELVASVRAGPSRALVLRGEAGVGKSALLEYLVRAARRGARVARAAGVESEMELAFAGLQQLCAPFVDRLERLPGPQRDALGTAFGLRDGDAPDRFLVGLAVLSLLSDAAEERPLVCVVDDAQWLDAASAQALAFVARRLGAESVGLVFAVREPAGERHLRGLPELVVGGLEDDDARALLEAVVAGPLDERVRDRIVAETRGNPLALLELPRGRTPAELAGGFGLDGGAGAVRPHRGALPGAAGGAAAGDAAAAPGRGGRAGGRSAAAVEGGRRARDRRRRGGAGAPTRAWSSSAPRCASAIRSCGRRSTGRPRRRTAGASTRRSPRPPTPPSIPIAARGTAPRRRPGSTRTSPPSWSARPARARARGGLAAGAAFHERAAELTPDPGPPGAARARSRRRASTRPARPTRRCGCWRWREAGPLDELDRARAQLLHAQITFATTRGRDAPPLLLEAAKRLEPLDATLARETYLDAFAAALSADRLVRGGDAREVAAAVLAADWGPLRRRALRSAPGRARPRSPARATPPGRRR